MRTRELSCSPNTVLNDRSVLMRFGRWCGDVQVSRITREGVTRYFVEEVAPRNNAASYNKVRQRISLLFQFCVGQGWMRTDALADIKKRPTERRERLRLQPDELLMLLRIADNARDRAVLATAMNTGLRASDLTSLRVRDVDVDSSLLHVYNRKSRIGDSLPMTVELRAELLLWLEKYRDDVMCDLEPDWYLFPARDWKRWSQQKPTLGWEWGPWQPERPISRPAEIVKRALVKSKLVTDPTHEGLHTIRRSVGRAFFDHASALGHDAALRVTASLLHHKSVTTTELYIGVSEDKQRRDAILKGESFLTAMVERKAEVVRLPSRRESIA